MHNKPRLLLCILGVELSLGSRAAMVPCGWRHSEAIGDRASLMSGTITLLRAMIEDVVVRKSMAEHQTLRLQESNSRPGHFRA